MSSQAFLTLINISIGITPILMYAITNLLMTTIISLEMKHTVTHFTTPFLKTYDM